MPEGQDPISPQGTKVEPPPSRMPEGQDPISPQDTKVEPPPSRIPTGPGPVSSEDADPTEGAQTPTRVQFDQPGNNPGAGQPGGKGGETPGREPTEKGDGDNGSKIDKSRNSKGGTPDGGPRGGKSHQPTDDSTTKRVPSVLDRNPGTYVKKNKATLTTPRIPQIPPNNSGLSQGGGAAGTDPTVALATSQRPPAADGSQTVSATT